MGARDTEPVDYPILRSSGSAVRDGKAARGILMCGSGVGASVAANKIPGIRAGLCHDPLFRPSGCRARRHERAGHGRRVIGESVALELVSAFLDAKYTGEDRHQRRLEMVLAIEKRYRGA